MGQFGYSQSRFQTDPLPSFHNGSELSCGLKIRRCVVVSNARRIGPNNALRGHLARFTLMEITLPTSRLLARVVKSLFRGINSGWPVIWAKL